MNAAAAKKPTTAAKGRMSALPTHEYLTLRIAESGKTNTEIAEEVGYPRPNVIAMLKTGGMRLPLNKVGPMARALGIDPVFLLEKVLTETSPELWDALRSVIGDRLVTENEIKTIQFMRKELNGFDANVIGYKEFTDAMRDGLRAISAHEKAVSNASIAALKRK
jgi:hypothetical protein